MTEDPQRLMWAGAALLLLLATCVGSLWPRKRVTGAAACLVLYASQTGQSEELARHTAARLAAGGLDATCISLRDATAEVLAAAKVVLCVAATTGDGDAPDEGLVFERGVMRQVLDLTGKRFAVLALGDRKYDHFCAFGRRVFDWLSATGAQALTPCLEVDDLDPTVLARWEELLARLGAAESFDAAVFVPWRLTARDRLNPLGEMPLYRVRLEPEGALPDWQAGDLAEIVTPDGHRRDYSLASLATEGFIELYVRAVAGGVGSGLLTHGLALGETVPLRLKSHPGFHAPDGDGPVLMIAAGSGMAGLRAHILQSRKPGWLIYGERHPVRDGALCAQARTLPLARLDFAFSQAESGDKLYVQDVLQAQGDAVRDYLGEDGAVLVCGGLAMGQAVEAALRTILGNSWVEKAILGSRYRRDLY